MRDMQCHPRNNILRLFQSFNYVIQTPISAPHAPLFQNPPPQMEISSINRLYNLVSLYDHILIVPYLLQFIKYLNNCTIHFAAITRNFSSVISYSQLQYEFYFQSWTLLLL